MTYDKATTLKMYLGWVNNFLTVERFAEYYNIRIGTAKMIIRVGRMMNDKLATKSVTV